jgi:tetratricopeptide (TPR) repeat protein
LFFPNEQNLQGLQTIVKHIRSEAAEPRKKSIDLHFVTSNIPDLDDEDHLLASRMERFKEHLGYETLATSIHHYNSLALLNQTIFTVDRPRSRLAQEYRELTGAIIRQNLEDTEGALDFLEKLMPRRLTISIEAPAKAIEERLGTIRQMHSHDGRILYHLGRVLKELGRVEEALDLFSQAADNAYSSASMLLDRAQLRRAQGNTEAALGDVCAVLNLADATYFEVSSAVRLLVDHDPDSLGALPDCQAFRALNDQERSLITRDLMFERRTLAVAERVLRALLSVSADVDFRSSVSNDLVLCLIGQGQFTEAMNTISPSRRPVPEGLTVYEAFNYAMAEWAETGRLPRDLFGRVVACDAERPLKNDLNKLQCGAIAHWALGDIETAGDRLREARDRMKRSPEAVFSSWRYLMASPRQFMEDLTAMTHLINGAPILPAFVPQSDLFSRRPIVN